MVQARQRCHSNMGRIQHRPSFEQDVTLGGLFCSFADVLTVAGLPRFGGAAQRKNRQAVVVGGHHAALAPQHRFGAGRYQPTRNNGTRLVRCQPLPRLAEDPRAAAVDGPPIHSGRGVVRHVLHSQGIRGQSAAQGCTERHGTWRNGSRGIERALPGLMPCVCRVMALVGGHRHSVSVPDSEYSLETLRASSKAAFMDASSLAWPIPRAMPAAYPAMKVVKGAAGRTTE